MVMPIFRETDIADTGAKPAIYEHRSSGTGTMIYVNFCPACGTKLYQTIERFKGIVAGRQRRVTSSSTMRRRAR